MQDFVLIAAIMFVYLIPLDSWSLRMPFNYPFMWYTDKQVNQVNKDMKEALWFFGGLVDQSWHIRSTDQW